MFKRKVATARNLSCRAPDEEEDVGEGQRPQQKSYARRFVLSVEGRVEV